MLLHMPRLNENVCSHSPKKKMTLNLVFTEALASHIRREAENGSIVPVAFFRNANVAFLWL